MGVKLLWEGFDEFRADLAKLPANLNQAARAEVRQATETTAAELRAVYPIGKPRKKYKGGALRAGVKVEIHSDAAATTGSVSSTAPHAHLWEFGTANRRSATHPELGQMKPQFNRGLIGIAMRRRAILRETLIGIVRAAGFVVTGAE